MNLVEALREHTEVCEEIYRLMLELNRELKVTNSLPTEPLLERQRMTLQTLDVSLERVRSLSAAGDEDAAALRLSLEKGRRTIMKALLLDRENEQLLLKSSVPPRQPPLAVRPTPTHLARLYGKHVTL